MSTKEQLEIERVFEIATRFVEDPSLFERYPDGSEFYIGHAQSAFEPGANDSNQSIQVRVKRGYSDLEEDF